MGFGDLLLPWKPVTRAKSQFWDSRAGQNTKIMAIQFSFKFGSYVKIELESVLSETEFSYHLSF